VQGSPQKSEVTAIQSPAFIEGSWCGNIEQFSIIRVFSQEV